MELSLPCRRGEEHRRFRHDLRRRHLSHRLQRLRRRALCLREPLRASRRADRAGEPRQRQGVHLRLSRLELRPAGQPQGGRLQGRHQGQGRHAAVVLHGAAQPAQAAARRSFRHHLREFLERRAAARGASRRGDLFADRPGNGRTHAGRARPLHAGASQQLEALHGERQGLLPRQHPASVLHHLRAQPPVADRRHHRRSLRRASHQLLRDRHRGGRDKQRLCRAEHPLRQRVQARRSLAAAKLQGISRQRHAADPLDLPDLHPAADPERDRRTPDRAARRRPHRPALDLARLRRGYAGAAHDPPEAGQSRRAGRLHLDGRRLRRRLRPARHRGRIRRGGRDRNGRRRTPIPARAA